MEAIVPMSMVNFDENQIIANGAKIYDQRAKIEAIADSIVDNGFDLLLFTSSGGSQAMLDPFAFYIRHMSRLPVENVLSANLLTGDCNRITDKTVAFLTSKSGDTAETVKAANWLKEQGVDEAESWLAEQGGAPVTALEESRSGSREEMTLFLAELAAPDDSGLLRTAEKLQKVPLSDLITWHQRWLYDLLSIRLTGRERYYPRYRQELSGMADRVDMDRLLKVLKTVNDRKRVADHPLVPRLVLEDMLLDYRKIFSPSASK